MLGEKASSIQLFLLGDYSTYESRKKQILIEWLAMHVAIKVIVVSNPLMG